MKKLTLLAMEKLIFTIIIAAALLAQRKHASNTQFTGTVTGITAGGTGSDLMDVTVRYVRETWSPTLFSATPACVGDLCWRIWENGGNNSTTGFVTAGSQPLRQLVLSTDGTSGSIRYGTPIEPGTTPFNSGSMSFAWGTKAGWDVSAQMEIDDVTTVKFGLGFDAGTDPFGGSANQITLFYDSTLGAAFRLRTCAAFSCTVTPSTVSAAAATKYTLRIFKNAGAGVSFSVNGETPISVTTNVPSVSLRLAAGVQSSAAAVRNATWYEFAAKVPR